MPLDAFALALGSAFLHALWNLILGRERDPEAATAIALVTSVVLFAPLAIWQFDADAEVWPFIAVTSMLQLTYFAALATAYRHADVSVVYPIARGLAPVLVLLVGVTMLGTGASAGQAAGVCLVGLGVMLVRGIGSGHADGRGVGAAFGVAVASCIAAYTLVDKHGIEHASPVVYLELGMIPATIGYVGFLLVTEHGTTRVRTAARPLPAARGHPLVRRLRPRARRARAGVRGGRRIRPRDERAHRRVPRRAARGRARRPGPSLRRGARRRRRRADRNGLAAVRRPGPARTRRASAGSAADAERAP